MFGDFRIIKRVPWPTMFFCLSLIIVLGLSGDPAWGNNRPRMHRISLCLCFCIIFEKRPTTPKANSLIVFNGLNSRMQWHNQCHPACTFWKFSKQCRNISPNHEVPCVVSRHYPLLHPWVLSTKERQVSSYKSIPNWYTLEVPKWPQPNRQCNDEWS